MAGNSAARRMLVQFAGQYQHIARIRLITACRHNECPKAVTDITWDLTAMRLRMPSNFRRLLAHKVTIEKPVDG